MIFWDSLPLRLNGHWGKMILYIPRTQLTSIFEGQPSKTRPFSIKARVILVLGIYTYLYIYIILYSKHLHAANLCMMPRDSVICNLESYYKINCYLEDHPIWPNYSDLTRPHPKWWFSKGNPLISGKSRLGSRAVVGGEWRVVKYYNLARSHLVSG